MRKISDDHLLEFSLICLICGSAAHIFKTALVYFILLLKAESRVALKLLVRSNAASKSPRMGRAAHQMDSMMS
jgi:hypothetical protein